jgi:hypothetical protein
MSVSYLIRKHHILLTTSETEFIQKQPHLPEFSSQSWHGYEIRIFLQRNFIKPAVRKAHHVTPSLELIRPGKVCANSAYDFSRFRFEGCMYERATIPDDVNLRVTRVCGALQNDQVDASVFGLKTFSRNRRVSIEKSYLTET